MARLVVTSNAPTSLVYELGTHWVTIGRAADNAFQIVQSSISGRHCEVLLRENELVVRDMRSTNGTFIQGKLIAEGVLKPGETLRLGDVELQVDFTPAGSVSLKPGVPVESQAVTKSPGNPPKAHQVLLVDDSMAFLETTGELFDVLSNGTWDIYRASGADQALAILQQHRIELVVLDINMPMLDGVQLLKMVHRRYPDIKKVMLTGESSESRRAACLEGGAELFLEKPGTPDGIRFIFNVLNDLLVWNQREGFSGTLRQVGLTDVIQIECLRGNSCILEIHAPHVQGEIFIEAGAIVHARAGTLVGEKALYQLLALHNGEFHLRPFKSSGDRTVEGSWEYLLMEAARVRDEEKNARANADTVLMSKPSLDSKPSDGRASTESPSGNDLGPSGLSKDIIVVSTYESSKWHPTDDSKK